ncbi:CopG family transcriptional regulator [Roseateles sp. BYS180W]|uniref:CopG family transcriptional regulator n=1 Tax=Roseateles rivi TaxID=3299028 RepID=A0ABW7FT22_9BURK
MPHITVQLDTATLALVERSALAQGLTPSQWVAALIHRHAAQDWPPECLALAGRFGDFPLNEPTAAQHPGDLPRLTF